MMSKLFGGAISMAIVVIVIGDSPVSAQFPNREAKPVRPRIDVIPPLGNNLPLSYRARMNRPTYVGGRIAYTIAPSSQEAMAWQRAWQRGYYADHAPRMETHYMFPKPWEVLGVGSKPKLAQDPKAGYIPPERLPLGPINEGEPIDDSPVLEEASPLNPEILDVPQPVREPETSATTSPAELVPRVRPDSRPQLDGPSTLELAPAIAFPVE
jgi:hypothetical protein